MVFPQAILFDMDGLMLDSESLYQAAWKTAAAELGYTLETELYLSLVGRSNAEATRAFGEVFGAEFPTDPFNQAWHTHWLTLVQSQGIPLKSGLLALLDWVDQQQIPKAVGTSSNAEEAAICLSTAGIRDRFATVVTVDQVANGKPEPDIFLEAAQRLGIEPARCLVLEDSNAGVTAAHQAEMAVIMVPDMQIPTPASQATALQVFASLEEVLAWLKCAYVASDEGSSPSGYTPGHGL